MHTILSFTIWARNHPLEWLSNKDPEEKDKILNPVRLKKKDTKESIGALKLKKKKKYPQNRKQQEVLEKTIKEKDSCCK